MSMEIRILSGALSGQAKRFEQAVVAIALRRGREEEIRIERADVVEHTVRGEVQHVGAGRFRLEARLGRVGADAHEAARIAVEMAEPFDFILGMRQRRE